MLKVKNRYLIDPTKITKYDENKEALQVKILFWVCAAGKNAKSSAQALNRFLTDAQEEYGLISRLLPFELIKHIDICDVNLPKMMQEAGIGCYNHKSRTFKELAYSELNLRTCTVQDLEGIYGIGPKTARGFLMHSRPNQRLACLDTHLLRWLRDQGYNVPKGTPSGKKYLKIESIYLDICDKNGCDPTEMDLAIWNKYSKSKG